MVLRRTRKILPIKIRSNEDAHFQNSLEDYFVSDSAGQNLIDVPFHPTPISLRILPSNITTNLSFDLPSFIDRHQSLFPMIVNAKLIHAVALACILRVTLAMPISHDNVAVDRDMIRSFPLQARNPQAGNLSGDLSFTPTDHDLSLPTLDPRNPNDDVTKAPEAPADQSRTNRAIGFLRRWDEPIKDKLAEAVDSKQWKISEEHSKLWLAYLGYEKKGLDSMYDHTFLKALQTARGEVEYAKRLIIENTERLRRLTRAAERAVPDTTCSPEVRWEAQIFLHSLVNVPENDRIAEEKGYQKKLEQEEHVATDGRLIRGWLLRVNLILDMTKGMTPDRYKVSMRPIIENQFKFVSPYLPEVDPLATQYSEVLRNAAQRFKDFLKDIDEALKGKEDPAIKFSMDHSAHSAQGSGR
ncbi:hypothetical protein H0H93_007317 [Arthromyces matolae]|nr:hypothetical protein H0H93_007317 [Arthromyces matolae]